MIDSIKIQNFKSIVNLELPLGRFNVIIGPNGCGKSNILEAISMASAASQDKLDNEYLVNRDVRVSDAKFMVNAFEDNEEEESDIASSSGDVISIQVKAPSSSFLCQLRYEESSKKWINYSSIFSKSLRDLLSLSLENDISKKDLVDDLTAKLAEVNINIDELKKALRNYPHPPQNLLLF